jgi:hypothetical protein
MGYSSLSIGIACLLLFLLPGLSLDGIHDWICGSCSLCHVCPLCESHINISTTCVGHESLNICKCNCITEERVQYYHQESNRQLKADLHNKKATRMNDYLAKHHFLFWLTGLLLCIILILFLLGGLVLLSPSILNRDIHWRTASRLHHRQHLMRKHNLTEKSLASTIELQSIHLQPLTQLTVVDLTQQLDSLKLQHLNLTYELEATRSARATPKFASTQRIACCFESSLFFSNLLTFFVSLMSNGEMLAIIYSSLILSYLILERMLRQ